MLKEHELGTEFLSFFCIFVFLCLLWLLFSSLLGLSAFRREALDALRRRRGGVHIRQDQSQLLELLGVAQPRSAPARNPPRPGRMRSVYGETAARYST